VELSIQDCFGLTVYSSDEKKIGTLLNLMINKLSFEATLLIFPGLKSEFAYRKVGKVASTASGIGSRILANLIPDLYDVVDIASEVQSEAVSELSQRADRKAMDIGSSYYCVPSVNAETLEDDNLILNIDAEECLSWYKNTPVSAEVEFVFFDNGCYNGPNRSIPISLNLQTIKGLLVYDPVGRSARLTDVKFNPGTGNATGFDVKYKGADKSIGTDFIHKDYDSFSTTIEFEEKKCSSESGFGFSEIQQIYLDATTTDTSRRIIMNFGRPKTVEELALELGYQDLSGISVDLEALEKLGAIICLTPNREVARQYYLTGAGLRIKNVLLGQERFEDLI
jgi:hypothetical protein